MADELQRRLYGAVGVGLLLLVGLFLRARGFGHPENGPVVEAQAVGVTAVALLFVVAAVPSRVTDTIPWYRLTGLGNVLLGVVVPLGFVGGGAFGSASPPSTAVGILGGLSLALIGVDQFVFGGRHVGSVTTEAERAQADEPSAEPQDGEPPE